MQLRIAIFDYIVTPSNAIGLCHRTLLKDLCFEHKFTVFAVEFDNPCPERIKFVKVQAVLRPLALLFITFQVAATICYLWSLLCGKRYDVVQGVESNFVFSTVTYAHFCHQQYLDMHWRKSGSSGLRGAARWLDHRLHSWLEPRALKRSTHVVVPSQGLYSEIVSRHPAVARKMTVIYNPVDLQKMKFGPAFDRSAFRSHLAFGQDDLVFVFVALGQFERKGLAHMLEALNLVKSNRARLLIVGGRNDLVVSWTRRAVALGVAARVHFVGMQRDVRPFLWSSDAFVLPSSYEVFPLVALQAGAAGLPLLCTPVNGVKEILVDGLNGLYLNRDPQQIAQVIDTLCAFTEEQLRNLGARARESVAKFDVPSFVQAWREFYANA